MDDDFDSLDEQLERTAAQLSDALFREAVAMTLAAFLLNRGDVGHLRNWHSDQSGREVPGRLLGIASISIEAGGRHVTYGDLIALAEQLEEP